jgi:hypothetical protein
MDFKHLLSEIVTRISGLKRIVILLAIAFAGVFAVHRFMEHRFCLEHICFAEASGKKDSALSSSLSPTDVPDSLKAILAQPYTYLDRGKQSYAFISQDGQYVLKFFDFHRMQRRAAAETSISEKQEKIRTKRLEQLISGYDTAYRYDREYSGLVFVQLAAHPEVDYHVTVRDRLGVRHSIPLNEVPFVVQKVAVPSRIAVGALLDHGDVAKAKDYFHQIIDMYLRGYQKGIFDADHNVMYNTGFAHGKPMRIDLGRLRKDESYQNPAAYQNDLDKIVFQRIDGWLERHFPLQRNEILSDLREYLQKS